MKIIIPMAGEGSRFTKIGFKKPKHEIVAKGKSLFHWSMLSLADFFDAEFVFIARKSHAARNFIEQECQKLDIGSFQIVEIDAKTEGQASTVMLADEFIDESDDIGIYNIDTYIEEGNLLRNQIPSGAAGFLPSFVAEGDKWSFVKTENEQSRKVVEVSEKVRISDLGTVGFYYFSMWGCFKDIYVSHKSDIKKKYRETYIAPMYQYMIDKWEAVFTSIIDGDAIHVLGTPEDILQFHPEYLSENTMSR